MTIYNHIANTEIGYWSGNGQNWYLKSVARHLFPMSLLKGRHNVQDLTLCIALHKALEILGVLPVHDWPNLALHASPTGLWTQQIRLKVAAKYSDVWQTSEEWDQILAS